MQSVMSHNFAQIPRTNMERSKFDRSHGFKTTFNSDDLVPFLVDEILPGDTFNVQTTLFARLATPIVPIMDNIFLDTFYFFVPNRLLWIHWEEFCGANKTTAGIQPTTYLMPKARSSSDTTGWAAEQIPDYMGIPPLLDCYTNGGINALPFRAYYRIYDDWYRDENLQTPIVHNTDDGPDDMPTMPLLKRGKRHDYFTSALPWPQKGPSVPLPLGSTAPVRGNGQGLGLTDGTDFIYESTNTGNAKMFQYAAIANYGTAASSTPVTGSDKVIGVSQIPANSGLVADLTSATAATINALRQAFQLQRMYERDARGGTRYVEILKSHFSVTSPDFRLQRSEYLGGSSTRVNINPVQQTSSTDAESPQGNLAAYGQAVNNGGFNKSFTEHGILIGLLNIRSDLTYQQGLNRMWSRSTRFDHYWPALAHLGEQEVYQKEIFADGTADDNIIFGYQERYAEYRYFPSIISGQMRSNFSTPLDMWHLSEDFGAAPGLNADFIISNTSDPLQRCLAVQTPYPEWILDAYIKMHCARPMPTYSVPGLIDHL